ncbi:hypothetical protein ATANTOWER_019621 [Ataeniobius toweri]|uniref:Uncharacterized protein n=1 Tax=Ataeniobius toweri TaxID=208326 RepID=A0ABU7A8M5_9TELE|nr:hypothetical protein [Ataeniobius toweri]
MNYNNSNKTNINRRVLRNRQGEDSKLKHLMQVNHDITPSPARAAPRRPTRVHDKRKKQPETRGRKGHWNEDKKQNKKEPKQGGREVVPRRHRVQKGSHKPWNPRRSPVDRRGSPENLCRNLGERRWNPQLSPGVWRGSLDNPRRGFGEVDRDKSTWMPSSKNTGTGT